MKKLILLFTVMFFCAAGLKANYSINNQSVDQLFSNAMEIHLTSFALASSNAFDMANYGYAFSSCDKNAIVAALLAFFLGGWAIHRYYLGTKPTMFFYYFCTCGGIFGVVPLVDFIMLLVDNKDISKYCKNEKFIMWM